MKNTMRSLLKSLCMIIALLLLAGSTLLASQNGNDLASSDELMMAEQEYMEYYFNIDVITATKRAQKAHEVPATIRVITAKQIKERGYFTLEDALADLPGIQFRNIQGFNTYTFIRGTVSQNNKILLLIDGIQINELNSGGFYGGGQFNLSNVKRIEVLYGPASALYGTNAISGIINIITRSPKDIAGKKSGHGGHISGLYGTFNSAN